jgi:hypothetical protein
MVESGESGRSGKVKSKLRSSEAQKFESAEFSIEAPPSNRFSNRERTGQPARGVNGRTSSASTCEG